MPNPSPSPTPEISHTLVGSYYLVDENIEAKLLLNNKGNAPLEVQPTLYNKQGQELQLPSVTVEPQNFRFINLADWAAIGGESYKSGNIKLFHYGKDLVLGAQIYLTDKTRSLSYEEKLTELGKFDSRRQEAVWWMPSNEAKVKIILTNTTDAPLDVTGRLAKKPNTVSNQQTVQLAAHQTRVFDLRDDFPNGNQFINAEILALTLEHSGAKDALLARVLLAEPQRGYSNVVQFSNPNGGKSNEYQGVGFQIEDIDGIRFAPIVVARNVGTTTATVTARVPYTRANGTRGTINLPQKQLSAGEMSLINTQNIITRVEQENIKVASLEVTYNTPNGSVIVAAHSVSEDRNQVFRVPMWDPFGQRSPTGGYPWRIEGTSVTQTYIKNIADYEEDYVAFLVWENGGMYMLGLKPIAAHETIKIDVKRLRDEQIPDEQGRMIPLHISSGQLQWTLRRKDNLPDDDARANLSLIGRSEQVDLTKGVTNNYACQNCCPGTHVNGFIIPNSQEIEFGETAHFIGVEVEETCYGFPYQFNISANWSSSNSSMGTISGGSITPQTVGQSNIGASWTSHFAIVYPCGPGGDEPLFWEFPNQTAENCDDYKFRRGGPNVVENENNLINSSMMSPPCGSCVYHGFTVIPPSATLDVRPRVMISPFEVVAKDSTYGVSVSVLGTTNATNLTLNLRRLNGTGSARFEDNNGETLPISTTGTYNIKGITESDSKDNYIIEAKYGNSVIASDRFSIAKIKMLRTVGTQQPTEITDLTTDTIIGERFKLSAEVIPSGLNISAHSWTIPGTRVKEFYVSDNTRTPQMGHSNPVEGLDTNSVNFIWVDSETKTRQVDYVATIGGTQVNGMSSFNVQKPTTSLTSVSGTTGVVPMYDGTFTWIILYPPSGGANGIVFTRGTTSFPPSFSGTFQFVQTTTIHITGTTTANQNINVQQGGLDGCYPYGLSQTTVPDTPGAALQANQPNYVAQTMTYDGDWKMYLMFKPDTTESDWVPVKLIDWSWVGRANLIAGSNPFQWTPVQVTNPGSPSGSDTTSYPNWTQIKPDPNGCNE
jgi:hypothetical protein